MQQLSDRDLLQVWENWIHQPLIYKSLELLALLDPDLDRETAASLPIGERDGRLMEIRKNLFGSQLQNATSCPTCGEQVEWEMSLDTFQPGISERSTDNQQVEVSFEEHKLVMRLPNSWDILEIMPLEDMEQQTNSLIERCTLQNALPFDRIEDYPEALRKAIVQQIEERDPRAYIEIGINCPGCSHSWNMTFDIMEYLWTEIDRYAQGLLQDIFVLAHHFGWSEHDILSMSKWRRNWYIQMLMA